MSDYIKREDVLQAIAGLLNVVEQIDSADVVEVVRCKDCKEYKIWGLDGTRICMRLGSYYGDTEPTDYCSYGERKEREHEHG